MTQEIEQDSVDRVLRLKQVLEVVGLSKTSIYAAIHSGEFPPPYKLYGRAVGWKESDIFRWIATRSPSHE